MEAGDGTIVEDRATRTAVAGPRAPRLDRIAAGILLAAVVVILGCAVVLGERETTVADLRRNIAAGDVTEVWLSDELSADSNGYGSVSVRWKEHGLSYVTSVMQASDERRARQARRDGAFPVVVVGDVAPALTTNGNSVTVVGHRDRHLGSTTTEIAGFTSPGWLGATGLVVMCATLLLVGSREPWRATSWAWAWFILLTPVVGVVAFLLFGGITRLAPPRPRHRRLTGGWAFLLASALAAAMN